MNDTDLAFVRLSQTELLDTFTEDNYPDPAPILTNTVPEEYRGSIGIRHAAFTWANDSTALAVTPGGTRRRAFMLNIDDEVFFQRGKINLIVGPTGAGKTSLLMALLGEMHYLPQSPDSFVSLPRAGGVAYAAQESWVQSDTIRVSHLVCANKRKRAEGELEQHCVWRAV